MVKNVIVTGIKKPLTVDIMLKLIQAIYIDAVLPEVVFLSPIQQIFILPDPEFLTGNYRQGGR